MENPAPAVFLCGAPEEYANYRAALTAAGLRPVVSRSLAAALGCEALLLPGGGDIHAFWDAHRPILGICRGMQALNVFRGGTLHDRIAGHQQPSGDMLHPTCAEGPLASLLGSCPTVNSNHHQAVARLGDGLRLCQWSADGIAEGLYAPQRPVLGVQWHPERQSFGLRRPDAVDAAPVFRWLRGALTNTDAPLYNRK